MRFYTILLVGVLLFTTQLQAQEIPAIVTQPADGSVVIYQGGSQLINQPVPAGAMIVLSVGATGPGLSYQWALNGDAIGGATNSTFTLTNAGVASGGSYAVNVLNAWGGVQSDRVIVKMDWPEITTSDSFEGAPVVTNANGIGWDYFWNETSEAGEPDQGDVPGVQSKWLTWVAPGSGVATFQTYGSSFDTVLAIYTGNCISNLTEVASDSDPFGHCGSFVMFNAQAGVAYRIAVGGNEEGDLENLVLNWELVPTTYPLPTVVSQPQSQTLLPGSSTVLSIIYQNTAPVSLQWYRNGMVISNATQNVLQLDSLGTTDLGVYTLSITSTEWTWWSKPIEIEFSDVGEGAGAARYKWHDSVNSPVGVATPPENNVMTAMASPSMPGHSGMLQFMTSVGKKRSDPNICGIIGGASYWITYVPSVSGTLYLDTTGSSFDTLLGVYIKNGTNWVQLACNDNANGLQTSALHTAVAAGATYYVMIDGKNGATGLCKLNYLLDNKPTISTIPTQSINEEQSAGPISFTVSDLETTANLVVTGVSANQFLVPNASITFSGSGSSRTVTITPIPYRYGTNTITISVSDAAGNTTSSSFTLRVCRINHAPIAGTDSYTRLPYCYIIIPLGAMLSNDTDIDGDTFFIDSVSPLSQAGCPVIIQGGSTVFYDPLVETSFDSFTYVVKDSNGAIALGVVDISAGPDGVFIVSY